MARRTGIAKAANKVIAVKDINVLDFMLSSSAECARTTRVAYPSTSALVFRGPQCETAGPTEPAMRLRSRRESMDAWVLQWVRSSRSERP